MFFEIRLCRPFSRSFQDGVSDSCYIDPKVLVKPKKLYITFPFGEVDELQCFGGHTEFLAFTVFLHTPPSSLPDFLICMFRWLCVTVALCFN